MPCHGNDLLSSFLISVIFLLCPVIKQILCQVPDDCHTFCFSCFFFFAPGARSENGRHFETSFISFHLIVSFCFRLSYVLFQSLCIHPVCFQTGQIHILQGDQGAFFYIPLQHRSVQQIKGRRMAGLFSLQKLRSQSVYGMVMTLNRKYCSPGQISVCRPCQYGYLATLRMRPYSHLVPQKNRYRRLKPHIMIWIIDAGIFSISADNVPFFF